MVLVPPLAAVVSVRSTLEVLRKIRLDPYGSGGYLSTLVVVIGLLIVLVLTYAFLAGLMLWNRSPGAVPRAILALAASAVVGAFLGALALVQRADVDTAAQLLASVPSPVVWIAYLLKSDRVRATYPDWQRFWERRNVEGERGAAEEHSSHSVDHGAIGASRRPTEQSLLPPEFSGSIRACRKCSAENPGALYKCRICGYSLSGTVPFSRPRSI